MDNLTIIVPFWRGHSTLPDLLDSIERDYQVIVINDYGSNSPDTGRWPNVRVENLNRRGYFSGACNRGFELAGERDVLILNQDTVLKHGWEQVLEANRQRYALIGDGVMKHPAWPMGYVQGTFMYIRRDALNAVGGFNERLYPLWGATCEFQLRACRAGFKALPLSDSSRMFFHRRRSGRAFGSSISQALREEPEKRRWFIRTPPEVSVIITTYNYGRYLEQAVSSVLDQTFQSTEIIIVDDGSTDDTKTIGERLADPWKGIHYLRQTNRGASAAANYGIRHSHGRYITVLDGDDWMAPTRLERLYEVAVKHPHSVVYDDVMFCYTDGRQEHKPLADYDFHRLLERNMMHKGMLYPVKAWREVGGYSNAMDDGREDWEFNIRLGLACWCGVHIPEPLYMYRRQGQGRTERNVKPRAYFADKLRQLHPNVYMNAERRREIGDRVMACCGGKRRTRPATVSISTTRRPAPTTAEPPEEGWVLMEYTGQSIANQTIFGPSYTRYKYGRNARNLRLWVRPDDVQFMLSTNLFKVVPLRTPEPAPKPEQVEKSTSEGEEPEPEPQQREISGTRAAVELAGRAGIELADVPHEGERVTVRDVRRYLDGLGVDY